ncbi:MAG: hypothetical protein JWQ97_881, partial [Phenylobacterium sp.]|nr:hypothetical protein [Phenylobacterium sp.]
MSVVPGPHERRAQDAAPLLLIEEI